MERIEKKRLAAGAVIMAMTALLMAILARPRHFTGGWEGEIPLDLPAKLGPYTGERMAFCQNDQCARSYIESELKGAGAILPWDSTDENPSKCPACGAALSEKSIGEYMKLPEGTPIFRKLYISAGGRAQIQATCVFSGNERRSIHQPQWCLTAQGNTLINEYNHELPIDNEGRTVTARVIDTLVEQRDAAGVVHRRYGKYLFWYFNPHYSTPSHFQRIRRVTIDNALHDYRPMWGYFSLAMMSDREDNDILKYMDQFGPHIYPILENTREAFRAAESSDSDD